MVGQKGFDTADALVHVFVPERNGVDCAFPVVYTHDFSFWCDVREQQAQMQDTGRAHNDGDAGDNVGQKKYVPVVMAQPNWLAIARVSTSTVAVKLGNANAVDTVIDVDANVSNGLAAADLSLCPTQTASSSASTGKCLELTASSDVASFAGPIANMYGASVDTAALLDEFVHPKHGRRSLCFRINYCGIGDAAMPATKAHYIHDCVRRHMASQWGVEMRESYHAALNDDE
jgi:hypothetical protein